jgi:short-subunit dehydrogenase
MATSRRTVLVTGATSGIGRATALALAARGHTVVGAGRRVDALDSLVAESSGAVTAFPLDVNDYEACATAPAAIKEALGGRSIDTLINNAGYSSAGPLELISAEALEAQLRTNVFGLHALTRAYLPTLRGRPNGNAGRIIIISSEMGRIAVPLHGAYNASKHALEAYSNALRAELRPLGVDVVIVEPGITRTGFNDVAVGHYEDTMRDDPVYGGALASVISTYGKSESRLLSHGPERVAKKIVRVVEVRSPRTRYGFFLGKFAVVAAHTPFVRLTDSIKRRIVGWHPRRTQA